MRANESARKLEERAKWQEYRLEQASLKMKKIEEEEREKCKKTAALMKEFEKASDKSPFFERLLEILTNFQGIYIFFWGGEIRNNSSLSLLRWN